MKKSKVILLIFIMVTIGALYLVALQFLNN